MSQEQAWKDKKKKAYKIKAKGGHNRKAVLSQFNNLIYENLVYNSGVSGTMVLFY